MAGTGGAAPRGSLREWIGLAANRRVVRRATTTAIVVGAFLIAINQGDAILHHDMPASRWLRMLLTVLVPYMVSTVSSVQAMRESAATLPTATPAPR